MKKPTFDFSGKVCRWIEDDPRDPNCRQCRKAPAASRSFCPEHQARAYKPVSTPNRTDDPAPWVKAPDADAHADAHADEHTEVAA